MNKSIFIIIIITYFLASMILGARESAADAGNCLDFDGTDDYVDLGSPDVLDTLAKHDFTIEMWIKTTDTGRSILLGNYDTNPSYNFEIYTGTTYPKLRTYLSGESHYSNELSMLADGNWHHVATVVSVSDSVKMYLDGVKVHGVSTTQGPITVSRNTMLARDPRTGSYYYGGQMDEVRVWNVARTQQEIQDNMNKTIDPATSGLVAYYRFDEGTAGGDNSTVTTLPDLTTDNIDGTVTNLALIGSTSNWVTSGALIDMALPVELSSFYAEITKQGIRLHWETAAEINNAGFNLYKNREFIAFVSGYGTTSDVHDYTYLDRNVTEGKIYTYELEDIEEDTGIATRHQAIAVIAGKGMVNNQDTPRVFALYQAYPNPFNPTTTIDFDLSEPAELHLAIYDASGKLIRTFANGNMWSGGTYSIIWNGTDDNGETVGSGTYFCKMVTEKYTETKSMVLLK